MALSKRQLAVALVVALAAAMAAAPATAQSCETGFKFDFGSGQYISQGDTSGSCRMANRRPCSDVSVHAAERGEHACRSSAPAFGQTDGPSRQKSTGPAQGGQSKTSMSQTSMCNIFLDSFHALVQRGLLATPAAPPRSFLTRLFTRIFACLDVQCHGNCCATDGDCPSSSCIANNLGGTNMNCKGNSKGSKVTTTMMQSSEK
eukprot:362977-Chlamydomonas_euryale.AAC.6